MRRRGALRPMEGLRIYNDLATNTRVSPKATWSNLNPARTSSRSPARVVVMAAQVEPSGRLGRPTNKNSAPTRTHGDPQDVTRGNITVVNVPLNLQRAPGSSDCPPNPNGIIGHSLKQSPDPRRDRGSDRDARTSVPRRLFMPTLSLTFCLVSATQNTASHERACGQSAAVRSTSTSWPENPSRVTPRSVLAVVNADPMTERVSWRQAAARTELSSLTT